MNATVDARAPRFGQAITATGTLAGVALGQPVLVFAVTVLLVVAVASRWRLDPYGLLWKQVVLRFVGPPSEMDSALPHRFARVVGATVTTLASAFLLAAMVADLPLLALAGYGLALFVGLLAALGATTGLCIGCKMYRQVGFFRDLGLLHGPAETGAPE